MKKLFHVFFRLLFGLALIGLGIRTLTDINRLDTYVNQTIDQIQHKYLKKNFNYDISPLKQHSLNILYAESFLFFSSGLFTIFGFGFAKLLAFLAVVIELGLVHNVYFYREPRHLVLASAFLGVFGGVLNM
jgi:hypothetical protein